MVNNHNNGEYKGKKVQVSNRWYETREKNNYFIIHITIRLYVNFTTNPDFWLGKIT